MLLKIAWRNIWRNRIRSSIVIGSIIFGVWALIFLLSFSTGMINSFIERSVNNELGHIQIHHPKYLDEPEVKYDVGDIENIRSKIVSQEGIQSIAHKTLITGMMSSAKGARGINIAGIHPDDESKVTTIHNNIKIGSYFKAKGKNQMLISKALADKMEVKERSKLVLTFQDIKGNITAGAFRVVGIFETYNSVFDEGIVFVQRSDINKLIENPDVAHEVVIKLNDLDQLESTTAQLQNLFPNLDVKTYRQLSPQVDLYENQIGIMFIIIIGIVMLALVFGIINTMLMAVLERYRELGILMAVGMNKMKVFLMILFETIMVTFIGAPIGMLLGIVTVGYYGSSGIDLSSFSQGMRQFGLSELIYPEITSDLIIAITVGVALTALIAAIYPARKAIKLDPVSAIRKL